MKAGKKALKNDFCIFVRVSFFEYKFKLHCSLKMLTNIVVAITCFQCFGKSKNRESALSGRNY